MRIFAAFGKSQMIVEKSQLKRVTVWCALKSGGIVGPFSFENEAGNALPVND